MNPILICLDLRLFNIGYACNWKIELTMRRSSSQFTILGVLEVQL